MLPLGLAIVAPGISVAWTPITLTPAQLWESSSSASLRRPLIRLPARAVLRIKVASGVAPTGDVKVFAQGRKRQRTLATVELAEGDHGKNSVTLPRIAGRHRIWFRYADCQSTSGSRSNPT